MFAMPRLSPKLRRLSFGILQDRKGRPRGNTVIQEYAIPPIPLQLFNKEAFQLLVRLKYAFTNLRQFDDNIKQIDMTEKSLQIGSKFGSFIFQAQAPISTLFYTSPISGVYKYYFDIDAERWVSNKDKHILEENLSRETTKYFKGYLDI